MTRTLQSALYFALGSACMAWRVHQTLSIDNPMKIPGAGQSFDRSHGYCGLAGKP